MSRQGRGGGAAPFPYLPERANVAEACAWLESTTGQPWSLARILEANVPIYVWYECPTDASPEVMQVVFGGDRAGLFTRIVGGGDLDYLKTVRDHGLLSFVHSHDGKVVKLEPPARFTPEAIRFERAALEALAVVDQPRPSSSTTGRKLSAEEDALIASMFKQGRAVAAISRELGLTRPMIDRSLQRSDLKKK